MIELERGEILVHVRDLDAARETFKRADEYFREIADRLPPEFKDSYLAVHHVSSKESIPTGEFREVPERPLDPKVEPDSAEVSSESVRIAAEQAELLRVASLLQEFPQAGSTGLFLHKVMNCLVQATQADEGFLLLREGDKVRVLLGVDRRGDKVKKAGERICLEALEETWDGNAPILATRILDDSRVQGYETFYRENIASVAIFPLRPDPSMKGALYLNNPGVEYLTPPAGSPALVAYTNLVQLTMPRPAPA